MILKNQFDRISKDEGDRFESFSILQLFQESLEYCLPLMCLDTFHVKKYAGVRDDVIISKQQSWIQVAMINHHS